MKNDSDRNQKETESDGGVDPHSPVDSGSRHFWQSSGAWQAIFTGCLLLVGIGTMCLVVKELRQITVQNKILEKSITASYQPTGIIFNPQIDNPPYKVCEKAGLGETCLSRDLKLRNMGPGPLILIGTMTYWSHQKTNLRKGLLSGNSKDLVFDGVLTEDRGALLLPISNAPPDRADRDFHARWPFVNLEKQGDEHFLYAIVLYSDKDGNLFDTIHVSHLTSVEIISIAEGGAGMVDIRYKNRGATDSFHRYSPEEIDSLVEAMKKRDHPLGGYIEDYIN